MPSAHASRRGPATEAAIEEEAGELRGFAQALRRRAQGFALEGFDREVAQALRLDQPVIAAECALELCARRLRRAWLDAAASNANCAYRSPTAPQMALGANAAAEDCGYERELRPTPLERRCRQFFGPARPGWSVDHVVLSSGQAAMAATLHLLDAFAPLRDKRPLALAHVGAYYETTQLLSLFPSLLRVVASGGAALRAPWRAAPDIVLVEPVFYDGRFMAVDFAALRERLRRGAARPHVVVCDDTLIGSNGRFGEVLFDRSDAAPLAVFRIGSGLKLLQGGLELANVGVVSIHAPDPGPTAAHDLAERLRQIRALFGFGLRQAEAAALQAPWFLDRDHTLRYQAAVFRNNALAARELAAGSRLFEGASHPAVDCAAGVAPFCALRLKRGGDAAYDRLEEQIAETARQRGILFEKGGSFGFRGHRFEVVRPENGAAPFLRVALGRRGGWSLAGAAALLKELR